MLVNEMVALPSPETLEYLSMVMSASPIPDMNMEEWYCALNYSLEQMDAQIEREYVAYVDTINIWYDDQIGSSQLLMVLKSEDMVQRNAELQADAPNPFYTRYYPYMVMLENMPQLKRNYRAAISSWADALVRDRTPLIFGTETLIERDYPKAPGMNFYADMDRRYNA
ncbi:hypothetical protein [Burkholderia phage BCSR5]|nr:hypothetical protein [Burkholderia phage BCSR5]